MKKNRNLFSMWICLGKLCSPERIQFHLIQWSSIKLVFHFSLARKTKQKQNKKNRDFNLRIGVLLPCDLLMLIWSLLRERIARYHQYIILITFVIMIDAC